MWCVTAPRTVRGDTPHDPSGQGVVLRIGPSEPDGLSLPLDSVREVLFSPDSRLVAVRGEPGDPTKSRMIHLIDLERKRASAEIDAGLAPLAGLCFALDGRSLAASAADGQADVQVWPLPDAGRGTTFAGGRGRPVFLDDSRTLAVRVASGGGDSVRWLRAANGEEVRRFLIPSTFVAEFSADAALLAATYRFNDSTLRLIDVASGRERKHMGSGGRQPTVLRFAPNGRTLAAAVPDAGVSLWEVATGEVVTTLRPGTAVLSVAFSPDDRLVATGGADGTVRVFETALGHEVVRWQDHAKPVSSVAFSPDGRRLASGSLDRTVVLRDASALRAAVLEAPVLSDDERVRLWDELGATSASVAYRGIERVRSTAVTTLPWLVERVRRQLLPPERGRIEALARELDDPDSAVRHRATEELKKLRELARPMLTALARQSPSAEVRWRARRILLWGDRTPRFLDSDVRRMHRVLHVVESASGQETAELIELIAREVPDADLKQNAARTLTAIRRKN